jgi:hypothetical protein
MAVEIPSGKILWTQNNLFMGNLLISGALAMYPPAISWPPGKDYGLLYYLESNGTNDEYFGYNIPKSFLENGQGVSLMWSQILPGPLSPDNYTHLQPMVGYTTPGHLPFIIAGEMYQPTYFWFLFFNGTDGTRFHTLGSLGPIAGYSASNFLNETTSIIYLVCNEIMYMYTVGDEGRLFELNVGVDFDTTGVRPQISGSVDSNGTVYVCFWGGNIWGVNLTGDIIYQVNVSRPVGCKGAIPTSNGVLINWDNGALGHYVAGPPPVVPIPSGPKGLSQTDSIIIGCVVGGIVLIALIAIFFRYRKTNYAALS